MTQNLDLDLSTNKTLTNSDTDLTTKTTWTPSASTQEPANNKVLWGDNATHSYDFGGPMHGNYYNLNAVSTGDVYGESSTSLENTICPKNWTIPTMAEWTGLFTTYNLSSSLNPGMLEVWHSNPFNFHSAGYYHPTDGAVNMGDTDDAEAGEIMIWTKNPDYGVSSWYADRIFFPYQNKYGVTVRCLATH